MRWIVIALLLINLGVFVWKTSEQNEGRRAEGPQPPAAEPGAARLPMLAELDPDALRERSEDGEREGVGESSQNDTAAADGEGEQVCYTLGPFKSGDATRDSIRTWLRGRVSDVNLRQDERREIALYWVYFPPTASRDEAVARMNALKAEGITDVQVVPKGDMANAVSLGVFRKSASRDRRLREMSAKGYEPKVSNRYRTVKADWLDVLVAPPATLDAAEFGDAFPGLELNATPCKKT